VEKVEKNKREEITHQENSQEERNLESGSSRPDGLNKLDYLAIREANMAENRAEMLKLGLVEEKKPKKVAVKRKKVPTPAPTRRSSRVKELPKVNYDDEDWEVEHFGKRRKVGAKKEQVDNVVMSMRKSPRELAMVDYGLIDANMDEEIFCNSCERWVVPPCTVCGDCGMQFVRPEELDLEVVASNVPGAGQGLFNNGATIPKGTLVGPYTGKFISFADYKQEEKKGRESGYAWLIYDSETMDKPCGYIDPGSAPDPTLNKLAKANHPSKKWQQSFIGCQFKGNIYYRAIKDVLQFQEVFVDYGPEYAAELGIDPSTYDTYTRPENHKTAALPCPFCATSFSSQHFLDMHLKNCRKKNPGGSEQRPVGVKFPCISLTCDKVFRSSVDMQRHYDAVHLKHKAFKCDTCGKRFTRRWCLKSHVESVHLEQKPFKCSTCGQLFKQGSHLKLHVDTVHLGKRPFICGDCGATFGEAGSLRRHITTRHSSMAPRYPCTEPGCSATFATTQGLKLHKMDHTGERPFPCPYESCSDRFKTQGEVNKHIKKAKKHAGHRLASKFLDKYLLPFTCQAEGCVNRYETEVERDRHMEKLHPRV